MILIAKDRKRSHYYLIKLLTILLEEDYDALEELLKAELDVEVSIRELIESSTGLSALEVDAHLFRYCSCCYLTVICFRMREMRACNFCKLLIVWRSKDHCMTEANNIVL